MRLWRKEGVIKVVSTVLLGDKEPTTYISGGRNLSTLEDMISEVPDLASLHVSDGTDLAKTTAHSSAQEGTEKSSSRSRWALIERKDRNFDVEFSAHMTVTPRLGSARPWLG